MSAPDPRVGRAEAVEVSTAGDRVVLYHRRSKHALVLNPTGSWIWDLLLEPRSVSGLVSELGRHYPTIPVDRLERDVTALIEELRGHDMVELLP